MNFQKEQNETKKFKKKITNIKHLLHNIANKEINKFVPNLSCRNFFHKSRQNKFFSIDQTNFDKFKFKNSSTSLFQSNDVDLVLNLDLDKIEQFNDDAILRDNLFNSLQNHTRDEDEEKMKDFLHEKLQHNENRFFQLPKLETLKALHRYKSYEIIHTHKRKIQNEMTEYYQKELIKRLKYLRKDVDTKKIEKNDIFEKLKKIREDIDNIDFENYLSLQKYKKKLDDIIKNNSEKPKEEDEENKSQVKFKKMKTKFINSENFTETTKLNNTKNNLNDNQNNSNIINNINKSIKSSRNYKNNELKNQSKVIIPKDKTFSKVDGKLFTKNMTKQSMKIFKINILQSIERKKLEDFKNSQKEKENNLKLNIKNFVNQLNKLDKELENIKKEEKEIVNKLMLFYKEILYKGKKVKKDGLVWIIKAIWYLGENVPLSFMPPFLDFDSIDYLFQLAHKQLEIEFFIRKINDMKLSLKNDLPKKYKNDIKKLNITSRNANKNNKICFLDKTKLYSKHDNTELINKNKKNVYKSLVKKFKKKNLEFGLINIPEINKINNVRKHIEKIKNDIVQLKQNEIKRIFKCFIENNYDEKYNTNIDTVLTALVGPDTRDTEINQYNIVKKNHILKLKKIRFFDHEYTKKIIV